MTTRSPGPPPPPPIPPPGATVAAASAGKSEQGYRRLFRGRFLWISIVVHILFALVAIYIIAVSITGPRKNTFKAGPKSPNPSTQAVEHNVQVAKKKNMMSAPPKTNRVLTTGLAKVALPEAPPVPDANLPTPASPGALPGLSANAISTAAGPSGKSGGIGATIFGMRQPGDGALVGTFYDLKQTRNRKPSNADYLQVLRGFFNDDWNPRAFRNFFTSPTQLFATQMWIPPIPAEEAPKAFDADNYVQPSQWVVHYRGTVRPPGDGRFRFVGSGDDILVVRFDKHVVLDGSLKFARGLAGWQPKEYVDQFQPIKYKAPFWNYGDWMDLKASQSYEIEILIGEFPGGEFESLLSYEKAGGRYDRNAEGAFILPVFQLKRTRIPKEKPPTPEYQNNGALWHGGS